MQLKNISTYEQTKTKEIRTDKSLFCKNEIIKQIDKAKIDKKNRKLSPEKENDIINDLLKKIQNLAMQAKSNCIHEQNKHIMGSKNKKTQKEITYYNRLIEKRKRIEQACIWLFKKRTIKNLTNGNIFKTLISQPENNRFQYISKNKKNIYDVIILKKETNNNKTTYQMETNKWKYFKFAVTIDKNKESDFFQVNNNELIQDWLEKTEQIIKDLLDKIP